MAETSCSNESPVSMQRVLECRKRHLDDDAIFDVKRQKLNCYIRLESESSIASDDDTESIYSIQAKETDIARDTSDTDTKSECDDSDVVEIEYEIASSDEEEKLFDDNSSSGTDDIIATAGAIAAICDSSIEAWLTDGEESDNSSLDDPSFGRAGFSTCVRCKSRNNNPLFRYCDKCFQLKKNFFPPRPKGKRKRKAKPAKPNPVKLDTLRSCLSGLSQDSGIGGSQEISSLDFNEIIVPEHLRTLEAKEPKEIIQPVAAASSAEPDVPRNEESAKVSVASESSSALPEYKELCIVCNNNPKNSVFLHGNFAHMCCCFKCAMKTWRTNKRCPICNCKAKNVLQVFIN